MRAAAKSQPKTGSVLESLGALAHAIRFEDLPADVVSDAKARILDTLGCAFGAHDSDVATAVRRMAADCGGAAQATLIGSSEKTSAPLATLVNGSLLRYLDSNDYYFSRDPAHPSGNLAAALAVAEREGRGGRDLIAALVAAYEIQLRLCDFAGEPSLWRRGWHHGTNAQFSTAAVAARLLRRRCAAHCPRHGDCRQSSEHAGATAERRDLDDQGYRRGVGCESGSRGRAPGASRHDRTACADGREGGLGRHGRGRGRFREAVRATRPLPADRHLHQAISGGRDRGRAGARRDRIAPRRPAAARPDCAHNCAPAGLRARHAIRACGAAPSRPDRKRAAQSLLLPAIALLDGACGEAQFTAGAIKSARVRELLAKIELREDPEFTALWPGSAGGAVELHLRDGATLSRRCPYPPGHPGLRLTECELAAKFHEYADPVLGHAGALALRHAVLDLDACQNIGEVTRLMSPQS